MKLRHSWTKDEIKSLVSLWETKTVDEIAEELKLQRQQITYMAGRIRHNGFKLTRHHRDGVTALLVKEAMKELGLKK